MMWWNKKTADDEIVTAAIVAGETAPNSWWITKHGTVLVSAPDVVLWVGGGKSELKFGVGMPPIYGKNDIAEIPISTKDKNLLWAAFKTVQAAQFMERRAKALGSIGRQL